MEIVIKQDVLQANQEQAQKVREKLKKAGVFMLNLISSPGAGKTTLLEKTIPVLKERYRMAVIEGDVETTRDAERLTQFGLPIAAVNTHGACHLESISITKAFEALDLENLDVIFVENVGNLVCPAEFDIGEDAKVALLSTPEGDDKVLKYPLLFREASLAILSKLDLTEVAGFKKQQFYKDLNDVKGDLPVIELSCKDGTNFDKWLAWLEEHIKAKRD